MAVKVEVKLDVPSVTDFTIHHICSGKIGIFRNVLGVLNVALAVAFLVKQQIALAVVFALFAAFVLGGLKMIIRNRVTKQMEHSNRLSVPVTYEFSEKGILTTTESVSYTHLYENKTFTRTGRKKEAEYRHDKRRNF